MLAHVLVQSKSREPPPFFSWHKKSLSIYFGLADDVTSSRFFFSFSFSFLCFRILQLLLQILFWDLLTLIHPHFFAVPVGLILLRSIEEARLPV